MSDAELSFWAKTAETHWGQQPRLSRLYGEYDLNFLAIDPDGSESVLKVMRPDCQRAEITVQIALIEQLAALRAVPVPALLPSLSGPVVVEAQDAEGGTRLLWRIARLPGTTFDQQAITPALIEQTGAMMARLHQGLQDFTHTSLDRSLKWDLCAAEWIVPELSVLDGDPALQAQIRRLMQWYGETGQALLKSLPQQAIHNDLNQQNLLALARPGEGPHLRGVIDFGDALYNPRLADLAICGAYMAMAQEQPVEALLALVRGYVQHAPLSLEELDALWPLLLVRLAVSVTNSGLGKRAFPDDPYVVISERPALDLLAFARALDPRFVRYRLRQTAGLGATQPPAFPSFSPRAALFETDLSQADVLDLTPDNLALSANQTQPDEAELDHYVAEATKANPLGLTLGRYGEARLIYGSAAFGALDHPARRRRTIHIGADVFLPAGTAVRAVLPGRVIFAEYRPDRHDYGGTLILEHQNPDGPSFRALYGHLSKASAERLKPGDTFEAGAVIAHLGTEAENGDWPPHLHLQVADTEASDHPDQWPGVVDADDWDLWAQLFPNPAALLGLDAEALHARPPSMASLQHRRAALTSANLKLSYQQPLHIIRGQGSFLIDAEGRRFLDAYNNVPHVGHAHPHVAKRVAEQVQRLSTNTRYLSELHLSYIEHLLSRFPAEYDTCFLVNSGSEANEVAMRLATVFTGRKDMAVSEVGYHGITQKALDISHYKFAGPGGQGQADWVHTLPIPNSFSGAFQGAGAGVAAAYAAEAAGLVNQLAEQDKPLAACLVEVFPSVGGQLIPPPGYLPALVDAVHAQGGLFIADEVQTGLGRLGAHFWAFEQQGIKPDMIVLGKPMGNGYPMGAVITRRDIAAAFSNGMEFFSTFGGSTPSCVAGKAVLEVLEDEALDQQAARAGTVLLDGLAELFAACVLPADVRGLGLFLGVELCHHDGSPATETVGQIVNSMRQKRVLMGSDGPHDSVLKIRPPLSFTEGDAAFLLEQMRASLRDLGLI